MIKQITFNTIASLMILSGCLAQQIKTTPEIIPAAAQTDKNTSRTKLDNILAALTKRTATLRSYHADIEYLFIQDPELIDSRTLQNGQIYYAKSGDRSKLMIDFQTRQQDDDKPEKHIQQFLFDGVWLAKIDYETKTANYYQKRPENDPADVFEYISHNFPMIGFAETGDLAREFDISLSPQPDDPNTPVHLHLKVKDNSIYKNDYKYIDFWVDRTIFLPTRLTAVSTEDDIYQISLKHPKINKKLKNSDFQLEPPDNFSKNIHKLDQHQN